MKLYELKRNTKFMIVDDGEVFLLDHIDGMYSVCYKEGDEDRTIYHVYAFEEVIPCDT